MARTVGIDVGGTKCLGVALDAAGEIVAEERLATPRGPGSVPALVDTLVTLASRLGPFDELGIGVPGLVTRTGVLRAAPNLDEVADVDVARLVGERVGREVRVDNDATCATVAEWLTGAGRGAADVVMVTLGTGIGGGLVAGDRLQRGANGFAGEFGHMMVDPDGPACPCGRRGCWERFASGSGLARLAGVAARDGRLGRVLALTDGGPDEIRGETVMRVARDGDPDALAVVDEFCRWVAVGLVNLANAVDPERFVLGGGLAADHDLVHGAIERWFRALIYQPELRPLPQVVFARWGEHAGAVGAALLHRLG